MKTNLLPVVIAGSLLVGGPIRAQDPAVPAQKPRALVGSELTFVKTTVQRMNLLLGMTQKKRRDTWLRRDETKAFAAKVTPELHKLWGELANLCTNSGQPVPAEMSDADRRKFQQIWKDKSDQRDYEWCKLVSEETRSLSDELATGASYSPLKQIVATWRPRLKQMSADADALAAKIK